MIVLSGKIPGRHYNYREILPGVIAAKSSAPQLGLLQARWAAADRVISLGGGSVSSEADNWYVSGDHASPEPDQVDYIRRRDEYSA